MKIQGKTGMQTVPKYSLQMEEFESQEEFPSAENMPNLEVDVVLDLLHKVLHLADNQLTLKQC